MTRLFFRIRACTSYALLLIALLSLPGSFAGAARLQPAELLMQAGTAQPGTPATPQDQSATSQSQPAAAQDQPASAPAATTGDTSSKTGSRYKTWLFIIGVAAGAGIAAGIAAGGSSGGHASTSGTTVTIGPGSTGTVGAPH